MIQESEEEVTSREIGDFDSDDFGIEEENLGMAYKAFMQYSNPIGSIVREITSNAWDANTEAGNTNPVVIEMSEKYPPDDERWIAFKDSGTGMVPLPRHTPDGRKAEKMFKEGDISEERMKEIWDIIKEKILDANVPSMLIYKMFFSSTKRNDISQLGYFGLGAKSPLGYADMFEVITRREGWKYHYVVRKGEEKPQLDLLTYEETDEDNGTTVRVPIASSSDWRQFKESIDTQLAYFDNVVFEGGIDEVNNDFTIYRGDHFIYRPDADFETMHICLGKVYYPLDFDVMDIREGYFNSYNNTRSGHKIPVGLYFPLEDQKELPIKVVWNRENIEYNESTKESIEKKLEMAKEELKDLYKKQFEDLSTVKEWYEAIEAFRSDVINIEDGVNIPITGKIISDSEKKAPIPKFDHFFDKTPGNPFYMIKFHRAVEDGYIDQDQEDIDLQNVFSNPDNYDPVFITRDKFSTKKNKWISENEINGSDFVILETRKLASDLDDSDQKEKIINRYKAYFTNKKHSNEDPKDTKLRAMLEFEKRARKVFFDKFRDYDEVSVSDSFKPSSKTKKTKSRASYDPDKKFPLKTSSLADYNEEYGWNRKRWKYNYLDTLDSRGTMVIYGFSADDKRLKRVMELMDNISVYNSRYNSFEKKKLFIVKIAKSREDMFSELRGSYHVDDFWESNHDIFRRIVTAFLIKSDLPDKSIVGKWSKFLPEAKKIYSELYDLKANYSFSYSGIHDKWVDDFLNDKAHLIDNSVVEKLETVKGYIMKYPLLTWLERGTPNLNGMCEEIGIEEEVRKYVEAQGEIHPHLLYRYKCYKNQQEDESQCKRHAKR